MDLDNFKLVSMLRERLDWLGERQRLLSQNIANANTPGYRARDLAEQTFADRLAARRTAGIRMVMTDPAHRLGTPPLSRHALAVDEMTQATSLSGNSVDLEGDLQKVAETNADYQTVINLYTRQLQLLKTAIGRPGG